MRRLAMIGCVLAGLLTPAPLALAAGKAARDMAAPVPPPEKLDSADARAMLRSSLESGAECDCGCADGLYGPGGAACSPGVGAPCGAMGGGSPQGECCCCECCCHSSGVWAMGELLLFRYHRADGVRVGTAGDAENAEFDFEMTPRVTLGWVHSSGLGVRGRYWEFDYNAPAQGPDEAGSQFDVDTYTIDVEVFETFCMNACWDVELSAGIRYNDYFEQMIDGPVPNPDLRGNAFSGYGVVVGAEFRRKVCPRGNLWFRARGSMLMDDKSVFNLDVGVATQQAVLTDCVVGQMELAVGYDYVLPLCNGSYLFAGVQAEWQTWYNYSSSFADVQGGNELFGGPSDVGFGGYGARLGIAR